MRIEISQPPGYPIMFPHPQCVYDRQLGKSICTDVTSSETRAVIMLARFRFGGFQWHIFLVSIDCVR